MFSSVVQLYRICERPLLEGGVFRYSGPDSPALQAAIRGCESLPGHLGRFDEDPEAERDDRVTLSWLCASNEHGRFYRDVGELVEESQSVHRGTLPSAFYLVDNDYLVGEPDPPMLLTRLERICELIRLLEQLTGTGNSVTDTGRGKTLLLVLPAGEKSPPKTLQMKTFIDHSALAAPELPLADLKALVATSTDGALHVEERRSIFRLALADVAASAPHGAQLFSHVIEQWDEVLGKYRHDVDCYISNFSFDKLRTELANIQTDFSAKLTKVMGDTTSRFLALPVPYVALAGILTIEDMLSSYLLFLGGLVVVLLYSATVHNQFLELGRTESAFNLVLGRLIKKARQGSTEIVKPIQDAEHAFHAQRRFLRRTLIGIRFIAWLPIAGGLALLAYRFNAPFREWILFQL